MSVVSRKLSRVLWLIVLVGAGWCPDSFAQVQPQSACQIATAPRTAIYFVNGVTTTLDEARLNGGKLELEFLNKLPTMAPSVQAMCHLFFLNINPTAGAVTDFLEAGQQRLGLTSTAVWTGLEGFGLVTSGAIVQVLQRPLTNADQIDQATITRHAAAYREQIAAPSCRRVLVVPHSQGNLYSNASFDNVFSQTPNPPVGTLKIVGVATPADTVRGNGLYRTSSTDLLIEGIRRVLPGTLPPNTNWSFSPLLLSPTYSGGHSFIGYLTAEPSRTQILMDMESSLVALASVNPC
ncbi:MAG TPA: hypothetical protein PKD12_02075 [Nitrospira sp.]|nr:hypothetical protein [Nitrospira sp.]